MAVPFAILLPALAYLFMQGGLQAFDGLGLTSWGSMDSYTLTAIPLFILMAECIQASGLGFRVYGGLARMFPAHAGWTDPDQHHWLCLVCGGQRIKHCDRRCSGQRRATTATQCAQLRPQAIDRIARSGRNGSASCFRRASR